MAELDLVKTYKDTAAALDLCERLRALETEALKLIPNSTIALPSENRRRAIARTELEKAFLVARWSVFPESLRRDAGSDVLKGVNPKSD